MSLFFLLSILIRLIGFASSLLMMRKLRDWRLGFLAAVLGLVAGYQLYLVYAVNRFLPWSIMGPNTDLYWFVESVLTLLAVQFVIRILDERRAVHRRLEEQEQHYKSLYDRNPDAICTLNPQGYVISCNEACERVIGYKPEDILYKHLAAYFPPEEHQRALAHFARALTGVQEHYETVLLHKDGHEIQLQCTHVPIVVNGEIVGVYAVVKDVSEQKHAEEKIRHLAYYDGLTQLPNRVLLEDRLHLELGRARRSSQMLAVLKLDLDRFKTVNETLGHAMGDQLLQAVTERLQACVREGDTVSRVSADEFALILPDLTCVEEAASVAQKILDSFTQPFLLDGIELFATASIGISVSSAEGEEMDLLIKHADTALTRAQQAGRNQYQLYTTAMDSPSRQRLALEGDLRKAIDREEFLVYYQPQINVHTGEMIGVEALVRWVHPLRGMISPGEFIPLAEETGLIVPIGEWVLRAACAQAKAWEAKGYPKLRVAVNLSARQFQRDDMADVIERVLKETGLQPQYLDLEITESMTMENVDRAIDMLHKLKNLGVHISLDDFGTGYSSLSYLKHFPIHMLKIDQSFVRDITTDPDDAAIAASIIALAHALGLHVIAEGVETEEQLAYLLGQGCHEMQGYLFSPPLPVEKFEEFLHFINKIEPIS